MICKYIKRYCKNYQDIENYDKAISDKKHMWVCHHRKEELGYSPSELESMNEYYNVPADDLIFLTMSEHRRLHMKGKQYAKGYHHTEEAKAKISEKKKINENKFRPKQERSCLKHIKEKPFLTKQRKRCLKNIKENHIQTNIKLR